MMELVSARGRFSAILAIVFGIVILAVPQVLAYMIGIYFIVLGILFFAGNVKALKYLPRYQIRVCLITENTKLSWF